MAIMDNGRPARVGNGKKLDLTAQKDDPARFDQDLLTEGEKEALRKKAREVVLQEQRDKLSDALYVKFLNEERKQRDPKKQTVPILLQLAPHAAYIMLDGMQYHTDQVYHVTEDIA